MTKVKLREKLISNGKKKSLVLDIYPPLVDPETNKKIRWEYLGIHIHANPKGELEREENKEKRIIAERIRADRQIEVLNESYGFANKRNKQLDFISLFNELVENKNSSKSNYEGWTSVYKHLKKFAGDSVKISDINERFCLDFKKYLLGHQKLSNNTASSYFDKFKSAFKSNEIKHLFKESPAVDIKSIPQEDTIREILTLDELKLLARTPFRDDRLKRASMFSALTGLRFVDIKKLIWSEIQYSREGGDFIRFKDKKTQHAQTQYLSNEARKFLGEKTEALENVFDGFQYSHCKKLSDWMTKAGISKKITFHCFRHTFATLQLTFGTDIYVICDLLGHTDVRTTQIYTKIVDEKKREAANKISLK